MKFEINRRVFQRFMIISAAVMMTLISFGCSSGMYQETVNSSDQKKEAENEYFRNETQELKMILRVGDETVEVNWENNESVNALQDLCREKPLTIQMSMYGGFEQVGSIGQSIPRNDKQTTTQSGDIVLYSGNQIVVFYGSNSWAYTRLGHITDKNADEMKELLGNGDTTLTIYFE